MPRGLPSEAPTVKALPALLLNQALLAGGYSVGVHTSPHLIRFNERVRINGEDAKDEELIRQFEKVEAARGRDDAVVL